VDLVEIRVCILFGKEQNDRLRKLAAAEPEQMLDILLAIGPATTSAGFGWRFDLNDNYHLLGYVRRAIENADATDRYSWYASVLFTF